MACLEDIVLMAKETFEAAEKKTGEVVAYSKLKLSVANINSDLSKAYRRLGIIVYDMTKNELNEPELVDRCVEEIDLLKNQKPQRGRK